MNGQWTLGCRAGTTKSHRLSQKAGRENHARAGPKTEDLGKKPSIPKHRNIFDSTFFCYFIFYYFCLSFISIFRGLWFFFTFCPLISFLSFPLILSFHVISYISCIFLCLLVFLFIISHNCSLTLLISTRLHFLIYLILLLSYYCLKFSCFHSLVPHPHFTSITTKLFKIPDS